MWNSTYHLRPTSDYTVYPWFYYYKLVSNANAIINNIDAAEGEENDKKFIKAQALTFRAYSFFRLAQLYTNRWSDHQGNTDGIVLRVDESLGEQAIATQAETYAADLQRPRRGHRPLSAEAIASARSSSSPVSM